MPMLGRAKYLDVGRVMDMSMDGSPIIDHTDINGSILMEVGAMVFKATPASGYCFAHFTCLAHILLLLNLGSIDLVGVL